MTERGPLPYRAPDDAASERDMSPSREMPPAWGRDRLAECLDAVPAHTHDVGWGDGMVYTIGTDPETASRLEVFPAAGVVRVTGPDAQITLFRQPPPSLNADRVRFEQLRPDGELAVTLTRRGRLRLDYFPILPEPESPDSRVSRPAPPAVAQPEHPLPVGTPVPEPVQNAPTGPEDVPDRIVMAPDTQTPVSGDSGRAEVPVQVPSDTDESPAVASTQPTTETGTEKPPRLNLSGRLGRTPSFRTTRNGTLIASFPLAVRDEAGQTTWHTVLAFGDRAEKLRETLAKGQHVEVIGYLHQRERTTRSGETRMIDEVYATVVKPR